jgi:chromosome segregation ATPase
LIAGERKIDELEKQKQDLTDENNKDKDLEKLKEEIKKLKIEKDGLSKHQKNVEKKQKLVKKQDDENKTIVKTLQLELKQKEEGFNRIQKKLQGSVATVTKLTQEKSDIESALATQKNLYNELRSKTTVLDNVIESGDEIQDEGVLESASS